MAFDRVAVNVIVEAEFSAILVDDAAKVTVGALSSSVIVIVTACVPLSLALPPETPLIAIVAVSSDAASYKLSFVGVKLTVPVVDPAEITISSKFPEPSV